MALSLRRPSRARRMVALGLCLGLAVTAAIVGCRSTPFTGRNQLLMIPESQEIALGAEAYREVLTEQPLSTNPQYNELVNRVGQRIAAVSGRPDFQWEFRVIASPEQNAFALPGGKVAIYEGILPICANEAGLAVVMSHEIGHALARHGGERMSQAAVVEGVGQSLEIATENKNEKDRALVRNVYGAASQYGFVLPYSREHEGEADAIGLQLMARAGYDPREAPQFWQRFAASKQGMQPPEFLSTHPSDANRAAALMQLLPTALAVYENAPTKYGQGVAILHTPAVNVAQRPATPPVAQQVGATTLSSAAPIRTPPSEPEPEFLPPVPANQTNWSASGASGVRTASHEEPAPASDPFEEPTFQAPLNMGDAAHP